MRTVFIRPERCIGCKQCEFACAVAHSFSRDPFLAHLERPTPVPRIRVVPLPHEAAYPSRCHHCDPAPCERACPTSAIRRDAALGVVDLNPARCIACAMCAMVCPFDAIVFTPRDAVEPSRVVATKCDGCVARLRQDLAPACVDACKTGALRFGEINALIEEDRANTALKATSQRNDAVEVGRA